uniref:Cytochrome c oxidase subunit 2 n=1 Tax=Saphonecrus sp. ZJUH 20220015 TaxID=2943460 RepID=A0A9E8GBJ1_9HYME|nr:cytochrome c oxidase subunit 2 [Saphonecrus sp. ZJUH 20220015]
MIKNNQKKFFKKMNTWMNMNLQDSNSPIMMYMISFHDFSLLMNLITLTIIMIMMIYISLNKFISMFIENQFIEFIWTIMPMYILILMVIPSLKILYLTDEMYTPLITIKCMGHQWFWSYEMPDFKNMNFESYMNKIFNKNSFRLLDVNTNLILPINTQIRLLISSNDVIHSFTVPSMGIKIDGIPGRLNQLNLFIIRPGMYFGQCSEICGANHSFMPIVLESTNMINFINSILNKMN